MLEYYGATQPENEEAQKVEEEEEDALEVEGLGQVVSVGSAERLKRFYKKPKVLCSQLTYLCAVITKLVNMDRL